jgi:Protein of unknown function (DUF3168)
VPFTALPLVQAAIFTVLSNDQALVALGAKVYDDIPDSPPYPYIAIGDGTEILWDTHEHDGRELTQTLDVWSDAKGYAAPEAILDVMNRLLHHQVLPLVGATWIHSLCEFAQPLRDPDLPRLRHIPARYRVWVQIP